jgi:hypothetical protein|nr:MAG: hypothetical protein [Lake Baikal virophage 10]
MSLVNLIGLTPKNPTVVTTISTLPIASPAFTPVLQTFTPTISATAPYQLTQAGLTSLNVSQWNALNNTKYTLSGRSDGTPVVYETEAFTGGSASTAQTLQYKATPLVTIGGVAQTNDVDIKFILPTIV